MLISPLMGPILGFGLSIAINDLETLKKSIINFSVMVVLSVFTAYLFFSFFPLREESSELLSRTEPDIRDVLIAFFGGLSLIIAKTKKGTISPVIFGVAIATALMPPLCTVGFGLAVGNASFSVGAMYLFMINSLYIVLATYITVKFLRFPLINYVNSTRRRLISRIVTLLSIVMLIPAFFTFADVLYESKFNNSVDEFFERELEGLKNKDYLKLNSKVNYNINNDGFLFPWRDKTSTIIFNSYGLEPLSNDIISLLKNKIKKYPHLSLTTIKFNQQETQNDFKEQKRFLVELRKRDSLDLEIKSNELVVLREKLKKLETKEFNNNLYKTLVEDIKFNYEEVSEMNFHINDYSNDDQKIIFYIKWNDDGDENRRKNSLKKIREWISLKLDSDLFEIQKVE